MELQVQEGYVHFSVPGLNKSCSTWYKIIGDLVGSNKVPLLILHGGPGAGHDYLLPLTDLTSKYSIPTIFYDQIGNGRSTHLPEKNGDEAFWTEDLFRSEIDNLIDHIGIRKEFDLYGHSWGGMLSAGYAALSPPGLRNLIISNSLASMDTWKVGINVLRSQLPQEVQNTLTECEQRKDFESKEYEAAIEVFYKRHLCLSKPWPAPEVQSALNHFSEDPTTYGTLYGPSELYITGSLRDWSCIEQLHMIKAPTLLLNGYQDEAQDICMRPFFQYINKVKWITLDNAAHFSHVDQRERYMEHVRTFLRN